MTNSGNFREHMYELDDPRLAAIRDLDAYQYAEFVKGDDFLAPIIKGWADLYSEPFKGATVDGTVVEGLFPLLPVAPAEEAPTGAMVSAALAFLDLLDEPTRTKATYELGAHEWRSWANPEFIQHQTGVRLEDLTSDEREAALAVVEASLSRAGFDLARTLMRVNAFLGDLTDLPNILGEYAYHFSIFGSPSLDAPWGWQLFGHHLALNCVAVEGRIVMSPVFAGAEPSYVDAGPLDGIHVFGDRIGLGRALVASLDDHQLAEAVTADLMQDPDMPAGRLHAGDERHMAGCFQDNRVIPNEGVRVADLTSESVRIVEQIVEAFLVFLPEGPAAARRREILTHSDETYFSWIGGTGPEDPFYYRIQNPVVVLELDHHCGIFLSNDSPMRFHIHTITRTPNGNDYGREYVSQVQADRARLPGDI